MFSCLGTFEYDLDMIGSGVGSGDYHGVCEGCFGGGKLTKFEIDNTEGSKSGIV